MLMIFLVVSVLRNARNAGLCPNAASDQEPEGLVMAEGCSGYGLVSRPQVFGNSKRSPNDVVLSREEPSNGKPKT